MEFDSQGWPANKIQLLVVSVGFFGGEGGSSTPLKFNSAFTLKKWWLQEDPFSFLVTLQVPCWLPALTEGDVWWEFYIFRKRTTFQTGKRSIRVVIYYRLNQRQLKQGVSAKEQTSCGWYCWWNLDGSNAEPHGMNMDEQGRVKGQKKLPTSETDARFLPSTGFTWFLNRDCYWDTSVAHGAWSQVWLVSAHGKFGKSLYPIFWPKIIATIFTRIPDHNHHHHHHHHQQQQQQQQSSFWSSSSCTAIMHISHLFLNTRTWSYYVFICKKPPWKFYFKHIIPSIIAPWLPHGGSPKNYT